MKKLLVGKKVLAFNTITKDVVVGAYTGEIIKGQIRYFKLKSTTWHSLNKTLSRCPEVSLNSNVWLLLSHTKKTKKVLSNVRKSTRDSIKLVLVIKSLQTKLKRLKNAVEKSDRQTNA